jgi:hypothetical protein
MRHAVRPRVDLAERDRADAVWRVILEPYAVTPAEQREVEKISKLHGRDSIVRRVAPAMVFGVKNDPSWNLAGNG